MANATATETFKVGETYTCRSACDHNTIWSFRVDTRTAKFITITEVTHGTDGKTSRVGVKTNNGEEWAMPMGSYSMAPVISA